MTSASDQGVRPIAGPTFKRVVAQRIEGSKRRTVAALIAAFADGGQPSCSANELADRLGWEPVKVRALLGRLRPMASWSARDAGGPATAWCCRSRAMRDPRRNGSAPDTVSHGEQVRALADELAGYGERLRALAEAIAACEVDSHRTRSPGDSDAEARVRAVLASGAPLTTRQVQRAAGKRRADVLKALKALGEAGEIERTPDGLWQPAQERPQ
jgi:hypothetical protein